MREIRFNIGDYIKQKGSNFIEKVTLELLCRTDVILEPIPLTEELLLKGGNAEIKPCELGVEVLERFIFIWKESYKYWYVVTKESNEYLTKIEFIHEYQNFIFSLNGTELQINL